jgi:protein O-mannosyl-transferase
MTITRRGLASVLVLCLVLGLGFLVYAPALGGAFLLDDVSNLGGLAKVDGLRSALLFIFSGDAGPLGRPIALATFALQADAWGGSAEPFILVNILIHLVNGGLLCWVLHRLSILSRVPQEARLFVAIAAAAIWLLMPLLASASLMVVQRMTTLSATFVLLGLGGYLHARTMIEHSPHRSMVLMSACLVIATAFAVLTKESGALLPVYVLVLESTVLPRPTAACNAWRIWKSAFLVAPAATIAVYIALRVPYDPTTILSRDFTGWERLITEARILWEYLLNAFVPRPGAFGPFHDAYPVSRTVFAPVTLAAIAAWIALLVLAIHQRRSRPFFALAVLWFLAGHSIESTVVPLELYFEHRNYLPVVGPVLALCSVLAYLPAARRRFALAGAAAYILISAAILLSQTWIWGDPPRAARYWHLQFPDSVRAATTVAKYRLASEGPRGAVHSLYRIVDRDPTAGYLLIPALNLSCIAAPQSDHENELRRLVDVLPNVDFSFAVGTMLSDLYTTAGRIDCEGVDGAAVMRLAEAVIRNPRYSENGAYNRLHHQLLARMLRDDARFEQAIFHLRRAVEFGGGADLNMMIVTTYADAGEYEAAREHIAMARSNVPLDPFRRFIWQSGLDELQIYIEALDSEKTPSILGVPTP